MKVSSRSRSLDNSVQLGRKPLKVSSYPDRLARPWTFRLSGLAYDRENHVFSQRTDTSLTFFVFRRCSLFHKFESI